MKKIFIFCVVCFAITTLQAQKKFNENTGKEIFKLLPVKMKDKNVKKENDRLKDAKGFLGWVCHRDYGDYNQSVRVECISNSPSLISVNAFLSDPTDNPNYLVTTIGGIKSIVQTINGEDGKIRYEALIPMTATLFTVRSTGYTRDDLIALANTIPVAKIAKMVEK